MIYIELKHILFYRQTIENGSYSKTQIPTFKLPLPPADPKPPHSCHPLFATALYLTSKLVRILTVEDTPTNIQFSKFILSKIQIKWWGFEFVLADDGVWAERKFSQANRDKRYTNIDLIFKDLIWCRWTAIKQPVRN